MDEVINNQPTLRDSDVIFIAVKRLEAVAQKMMRYEYDEELNRLMAEAEHMLDWLTDNIKARER